jgi:DNA polymerase
MSLSLDQRQRAMLREMGVRVWLPAGPVVALDSGASNEGDARAKDHFHEDKPVARSGVNRPAPQVSSAPVPTPPTAAPAGGEQASWRLGAARALYPQAAPAPGARWLVLAETSVAALDADPLQGDAGRLLGNMLRAARMNDSGTVLLAPLVRQAAADPTADFSAALAVLVAQHQPDLVLVMGRLAAQAVLRSTVPFGKLRGQVHSLNGATTLVTYDAPYLLRRPADKARAWEDLCLAISLARAA